MTEKYTIKYQKIGSRVLIGNMTISKRKVVEGFVSTLCFLVESGNGAEEFCDIALTVQQLQELKSVVDEALRIEHLFPVKDNH